MKVCCVADLHENLIEIPDCDLLLIGGDITYAFYGDKLSQYKFMNEKLRPWLHELRERGIYTIATPGNHDQNIQAGLYPKDLEWTLLIDEWMALGGLNFYGSPWQPWFYDWAYNFPQGPLGEIMAEETWAKIPEQTDILLLHGPPKGCGDKPHPGQPGTGCKYLRERIEVVKPKLVVCGHIHAGYGSYKIGDTEVINASVVNNTYKQVNDPVVIEL